MREKEVPVKIQDGKLYISDDYFHELLEPIWFIKYLFGQAGYRRFTMADAIRESLELWANRENIGRESHD